MAEAIALGQAFVQMLRNRGSELLEDWLTRATQSALPPFHRLAKSFRHDFAAIHAGLTLPWSTGPVEGHINRLKLVKRQMFGRAKLDLLASRFLATPPPTLAQQIGCTAAKPLAQQPVMIEAHFQPTDRHPIATLELTQEDHQKWP